MRFAEWERTGAYDFPAWDGPEVVEPLAEVPATSLVDFSGCPLPGLPRNPRIRAPSGLWDLGGHELGDNCG